MPRPDPKPRPHNYIAKVLKFSAENPIPPGQFREILMIHDDHCGLPDRSPTKLKDSLPCPSRRAMSPRRFERH